MAIYKDVEPLEVMSYKSVNEDFDNGVKYVLEKLDALPTADVVSQEAIEQLKWERDTAIKQLQSYGVGFGENKELTEVKHGEWETTDTPLGRCCVCTVCGSCPTMEYNYCPYCGAKMDGERKGMIIYGKNNLTMQGHPDIAGNRKDD